MRELKALIPRFLSLPEAQPSTATVALSHQLLIGNDWGRVDLLDFTHPIPKQKSFLSNHKSRLTFLAVLHGPPWSNKFLVTTNGDGYIEIWSLTRRQVVAQELVGRGSINAAALDVRQNLIVANSDGSIMKYCIEADAYASEDAAPLQRRSASDSQRLNPWKPNIAIRYEKTICKGTDPHTAICICGDNLVCGTDGGGLLMWDLKTYSCRYRMNLARSRPKSRKRSKRDHESPSDALQSSAAILLQVAEDEQAKELPEALEKEAGQRVSITSSCYDEASSVVIVADSHGSVTIIDLQTFTVLQEFAVHEGPATAVKCLAPADKGQSVFVSCGADGRLALYIQGHSGRWKHSVTRFAHLIDAIAVEQLGSKSVVVVGIDGSLAIYESGQRSVQELGAMPRRIAAPTNVTAQVHRGKRLVLETYYSQDVLTLWTLVARSNKADGKVEPCILSAARDLLRLPETRALTHIWGESTAVAEPVQWQAVKLLTISSSAPESRFLDAAIVDQSGASRSDEPIIAVLQSDGALKLVSLNLATLESATDTLPLRQILKKRDPLGLHSVPELGSYVAVTFVTAAHDGFTGVHGIAFINVEEPRVEHTQELPAALKFAKNFSMEPEGRTLIVLALEDGSITALTAWSESSKSGKKLKASLKVEVVGEWRRLGAIPPIDICCAGSERLYTLYPTNEIRLIGLKAGLMSLSFNQKSEFVFSIGRDRFSQDNKPISILALPPTEGEEEDRIVVVQRQNVVSLETRPADAPSRKIEVTRQCTFRQLLRGAQVSYACLRGLTEDWGPAFDGKAGIVMLAASTETGIAPILRRKYQAQ